MIQFQSQHSNQEVEAMVRVIGDLKRLIDDQNLCLKIYLEKHPVLGQLLSKFLNINLLQSHNLQEAQNFLIEVLMQYYKETANV